MKKKLNLRESVILVVGMFIVAVAVYYMMMPGGFVLGSLSGLVIVLVNFIPLPVSVLTFIINGIPCNI